MTAKKTANLTDTGGQRRMIMESEGAQSNRSGPQWRPGDGSPAVFKTVCGALMRRPGWVRFPSIPANLPTRGSQDDGHRSERPRTLAGCSGLRPGVEPSKLFLERSANVTANTFTEPALAGDSDVDRTIARPSTSPSLESC